MSFPSSSLGNWGVMAVASEPIQIPGGSAGTIVCLDCREFSKPDHFSTRLQ